MEFITISFIVLTAVVFVSFVIMLRLFLQKTEAITMSFLAHIHDLQMQIKADSLYQYNQVKAAQTVQKIENIIADQVTQSLEKQELKNSEELPDVHEFASDPLAQRKFINNFQGIVEE